MKQGQIILLSVLAIGATIGTVIAVKKARAAASPEPAGNTGGGGTLPNTGGNTGGGSGTLPANNTGLNYNLVLKNGSGFINNRAEVKALQLMLNKLEASSPLVVDGMFGPLTEAKLKRLNNGFGQISLAQAKIKWPFA